MVGKVISTRSARKFCLRAMCAAGGLLIGLAVASGPGQTADKKDGGPPSFSGLWFPAGGGKRAPNPLPFTPKAQAEHDAYVAKFTDDDDPGRYCITPGMPRAIWGAPFAVELFDSPKDLTIYWEGYNQYRKIYKEGFDRPDPIIDTQMGYSVGHWEGDTLVIETDHLKPYPYMNRLPTSSSAHIVERMHLEERETNGEKRKYLVDELVLTDPKVYTEPIHITSLLVYRPDTQVLEYSCSDLLWDEYLQKRGLTLPDLDSN
jgi:hypothetical protein